MGKLVLHISAYFPSVIFKLVTEPENIHIASLGFLVHGSDGEVYQSPAYRDTFSSLYEVDAQAIPAHEYPTANSNHHIFSAILISRPTR